MFVLPKIAGVERILTNLHKNVVASGIVFLSWVSLNSYTEHPIPKITPQRGLELRHYLGSLLFHRELESKLRDSSSVWGKCKPHSCFKPWKRVSLS